jgi:hypothetical protein
LDNVKGRVSRFSRCFDGKLAARLCAALTVFALVSPSLAVCECPAVTQAGSGCPCCKATSPASPVGQGILAVNTCGHECRATAANRPIAETVALQSATTVPALPEATVAPHGGLPGTPVALGAGAAPPRFLSRPPTILRL